MKIEKNGFYKLSQINKRRINIWDNVFVIIFDDVGKEVNINLWENSKLEFYWLYDLEKNIININFNQLGKNSSLVIKCLVLPKVNKDWEKQFELKIFSNIQNNFCKSLLNIVSFVINESKVNIDWIIKIEKGLSWVNWNIVEENIFLWNIGSFAWKPILQVGSNDVKAGHSCKIERINEEKLFYLKSRWLSNKEAMSLMLEAKVKNLFSCLSMIDNIFYDRLIEKILLNLY